MLRCGADGLVLFNRFLQPDINPEELIVEPGTILSSPHDLRLPMRWIAILYGRINADLACTSGVQRGHDAIKVLMAGAKLLKCVQPYYVMVLIILKSWRRI